ncbi:MAG: hypothetical protein UZ15_CFX003000791 [Chloroflexi bacterium OLB15]|nr:MAG: hypothetical protein UZ15_CFX003000791 [Chloroflexi bacterium OLB15]
MNVNVQEILVLLGPGSGDLVWNIMIYAVFFLALISLLLMPDKNLLPTLLVAGVMFAAVVAKLSLSVGFGQRPILKECEFGMLIINIVMFIFPLLAAGILRAKKKAKVVIPLILCAITGFLFFFLYWLLVQNVQCPMWA